jgi:hypothetical protein
MMSFTLHIALLSGNEFKMSLHDLMEDCDYDQNQFGRHAFQKVCCECNVTEVEFIYLNQIAGPNIF